MRLNKFLAQYTNLSRRKADEAIKNGEVTIDGEIAEVGNVVKLRSVVCLNGVEIKPSKKENRIVLLDKPIGYVCSKDGQGSPTVYDLLPDDNKDLNIAGRLDKDSSGLVILTDDGDLLNELTHPSNDKEKVYEVTLNNEMDTKELQKSLIGVDIGDERLSKFQSVEKIGDKKYRVILSEGRNRQIRRTFKSLGLNVVALRRLQIGDYSLKNITQ